MSNRVQHWRVGSQPRMGVDGHLVTVVVDAEGLPVAHCGSGPTGHANALLVAAAPEMLRLLAAAYWEHYDLPEEGRSRWLFATEGLLKEMGVLP